MSYDFKDKYVFLSGPMTGKPDWNREAFESWGRMVRKWGALKVYNPAKDAPHGDDPHTHEHWMVGTLHELTQYYNFRGNRELMYDVLALLPGWEESEGARVEKAVAEAIGEEVVEL